MPLDKKSLAKLKGIHPDLVRVIKRAHAESETPFIIVEGMRTKERQAELFAQGATTTMNSRHLTGHAVDFNPMLNGKPTPSHWPLFRKVGAVIKAAALTENVAVTLGVDWQKFPDGAHVELSWKAYPLLSPEVKAPSTTPTVQGAAVSSVGVAGSSVTEILSEVQSSLSPLTAYLDIAKWVFVGLIVAGLVYVVWQKYSAYRKGLE